LLRHVFLDQRIDHVGIDKPGGADDKHGTSSDVRHRIALAWIGHKNTPRAVAKMMPLGVG